LRSPFPPWLKTLPPCWATPPAPSPRPPATYAELHQVSTYGCTTHYFGYDRGTCALDGDRILLTQQQRSLNKGRAGAFACRTRYPSALLNVSEATSVAVLRTAMRARWMSPCLPCNARSQPSSDMKQSC